MGGQERLRNVGSGFPWKPAQPAFQAKALNHAHVLKQLLSEFVIYLVSFKTHSDTRLLFPGQFHNTGFSLRNISSFSRVSVRVCNYHFPETCQFRSTLFSTSWDSELCEKGETTWVPVSCKVRTKRQPSPLPGLSSSRKYALLLLLN